MNPQKQELLDKLKGANNILVTVSANPSVDQLAACIGMTLLLNKLKKHATAVFSGQVPSTIEFLKPEETIEKTTDSLRDFIISLDKSKADKLRYKVEDQVVRIFITPYRTSISEKDLDFSQGDFNVDVVLCLGINQQQEIDQAITSHGRILHDAVVVSVNIHPGSELGSINWTEPAGSSLSELVAELADGLGKELLDSQISTSLLTGIVAETDRFSNEKTTPETMTISAELMAAGANQQLVASELEPQEIPLVGDDKPRADNGGDRQPPPAATAQDDGTLEISHVDTKSDEHDKGLELPEPQQEQESDSPLLPPPEIDHNLIKDVKQSTFEDVASGQNPELQNLSEPATGSEIPETPASRIMLQPPSLGGTLTANSNPEDEEDGVQDPLSIDPSSQGHPMLEHGNPGSPPRPAVVSPQLPTATALPQVTQPLPPPAPVPLPPVTLPTPLQPPAYDPLAAFSSPTVTTPPAPAPVPFAAPAEPPVATPAQPSPSVPAVSDTETLSEIEQSVHSPHLSTATPPPIGSPELPEQPMPQDSPTAPAAPPPASADDDQDIEAARNAVMSAINSAPPSGLPEPKMAAGASGYLNVQDLPGINEGVPPISPQPIHIPDLTDAAANAPGAPAPLTPPPLPSADPTGASPASKTDAPPPVPPPLPLDDLSKFTSPSP